MKNIFLFLVLFAACTNICFSQVRRDGSSQIPSVVRLPEPKQNGQISLEQALQNRRSVRQFTDVPLTLEQISQLCWAAQGITEPNRGLRTAPSAGALYPIELYVVLPDGLFLYNPAKHELSLVAAGDLRNSVFNSSFNQRVVQKSPCTFIIAGDVKKIEARYRSRGAKFTYFEVGHIAQNIQLQAVTLGLGSVPIGVIDEKTIAQICKMPQGLEVMYLISVGNTPEKPRLQTLIPAVGAYQQPSAGAALSSKKVAIIIPSKYFNDADFYGIEQALVKEGIQPVIASTELGEVKGIQISGIQRNILTPKVLVRNLKAEDFDAFVFVGGTSSSGNYLTNRGIIDLIRAAYSANKILAAIAEAPGLFANADIIRGKNVTSATSQRYRMIQAGGKWDRNPLVVDGNILTAGQSPVTSTNPGSAGVADRLGTAVISALRTQK